MGSGSCIVVRTRLPSVSPSPSRMLATEWHGATRELLLVNRTADSVYICLIPGLQRIVSVAIGRIAGRVRYRVHCGQPPMH